MDKPASLNMDGRWGPNRWCVSGKGYFNFMIFRWSCCWKKSCTTWVSRVSVPVIPRISPPKMMIWRESSWNWEKIQFQFGETILKGQFCQEFILLRVILPWNSRSLGVLPLEDLEVWPIHTRSCGPRKRMMLMVVVVNVIVVTVTVVVLFFCWWSSLLFRIYLYVLYEYNCMYIYVFIYLFIYLCMIYFPPPQKKTPDLLPWSWLRHQHLDQFLLYTGGATPVEPFMKFQGSR